MPKGGARKGAGRKPKPLAEKIAAGNLGNRPLKKVVFENGDADHRPAAPEYLNGLARKHMSNAPTPIELYHETVQYLEPSDCLNLIPSALIADYVMAKYYLICAQFELSKTLTVAKVEVGGKNKSEYKITDFTEAVLKLQKNVIATWTPIWDIVSKNSTRLIDNPEEDLLAMIIGGRVRRKPKEAKSNG